MAGYEQLVPGSANRILTMAEKEQTFRHKRIETDQRHALVSRVGVLGLGFVILLVAGYLIHQGQTLLGLVALVGAMGSFVSIFLWGTPRGGTQDAEGDGDDTAAGSA